MSTANHRAIITSERLHQEQREESVSSRVAQTLPHELDEQAREQLTQERLRAEERVQTMTQRAATSPVEPPALLFQKILVALDTSPASQSIYAHALQIAVLHRASLLLLHILSAEDDGFSNPASSGEFYPFLGEDGYEQYFAARDHAYAQATERMTALVKEAAALGVTAEFALEEGSPERVIRRRVAEWGADLVVIGRRGHSGLSELFLGSVSNYVLHHVACPILVLQGESLKP